MSYLGTKPGHQVATAQQIADGVVTPAKLSTGAPSWDTTGQLTLLRNDTSSEGGQINFQRASDGTANWYIDAYGNTSTPTLRFVDGANVRMALDGSGNVGIGTASPSVNLEVTGGGSPSIKVSSPSNVYTYLTMNAWALDRAQLRAEAANPGAGSGTGSGILSFWTANNSALAERMRLDSSGNLLVGTVSALGSYTSKVHVLGTSGANDTGIVIQSPVASGGTYAYMQRFLNSSGTQVGYISASGAATSYATSSDYRLKENITSMTGALATVQRLNPVSYTWKSTGEATQGFIAHELQAVVPECVTGEKDAVDADGNPIYQGIDTSFLVATLTAAIQELKAELDAAKADIALLKGR